VSKTIPPVDLPKLESLFAQLERQGVTYRLGAKANQLHDPPSKITALDCSGFVRWIIAQATDFQLILPDGSQMQREWASTAGLHQLSKYSDCNTYLTEKRLFIAFIRPNYNGAGTIGHVWLCGQFDNDREAETMESRGGIGVDSRPWDSLVLRKQVYSCFELPTA
jgi:hypothetical protein